MRVTAPSYKHKLKAAFARLMFSVGLPFSSKSSSMEAARQSHSEATTHSIRH